MRRLGYSRYVAQGGDVGAGVSDAMGRQAPEGLLGIHMNLLVTALGGPQPADTEQERAAAAALAEFQATGFAYFLEDRKSTRLNSSHANISYAVFCLKKKKQY